MEKHGGGGGDCSSRVVLHISLISKMILIFAYLWLNIQYHVAVSQLGTELQSFRVEGGDRWGDTCSPGAP